MARPILFISGEKISPQYKPGVLNWSNFALHPDGHVAMFGDIFDCRISGRKKEARPAAQHATGQRTAPHNKGLISSPKALQVLTLKNSIVIKHP